MNLLWNVIRNLSGICKKIKADFFDRIYLILQHGGQYLQIQADRFYRIDWENWIQNIKNIQKKAYSLYSYYHLHFILFPLIEILLPLQYFFFLRDVISTFLISLIDSYIPDTIYAFCPEMHYFFFKFLLIFLLVRICRRIDQEENRIIYICYFLLIFTIYFRYF